MNPVRVELLLLEVESCDVEFEGRVPESVASSYELDVSMKLRVGDGEGSDAIRAGDGVEEGA